LCELGRGKGIVFSPDLSEPGNRQFFQSLGFAYFEDPDWRTVLGQLKEFNRVHPDSPVQVLLIESHGTNGDALKLQAGKQLDDPRSYLSAGALLENLEGSGVKIVLLAACNSGRLLRPERFHELTPVEGNPLWEPATLGIINSSKQFDASEMSVTIGRRAESHIEIINECHISEFSPSVRSVLSSTSNARLQSGTRIAVPEMLIQLLLADQRLNLVSEGFEVVKSADETNDAYREQLITRFLRFVNGVAEKEQHSKKSANEAD